MNRLKIVSAAMMVVGVGLTVFAFSDYTAAADGAFSGWSDSCRYAMTVGAMLATGGKLLS